MRTASPTDWKTKEFPAQHSTVSLDQTFSPDEMVCIRRGVVPEQMEDKWFIYWKENTLYFHRSWTGRCVYVVRFKVDRDGGHMFEADVNQEDERDRDAGDEHHAWMISYLINVILLRRVVVLPDNHPLSDFSQGWGLIGRARHGKHPGQV